MADNVSYLKVAAPNPGQSEPLVIIPGDLDQARGYKVGKWREWPNYECIYCQYKTIYIEKMEKHQVEGQHPWAFPGQNPRTPGQVHKPTVPTY